MAGIFDSLKDSIRDALAQVGLTPKGALVLLGVVVAVARTRRWAAGGRLSAADAKKDLSGKTYVVTGGCGGIGIETVKQLALQGATVVAAARDYEKSHTYLARMKSSLPKEAADRISFEGLDLADLESVRAFAKRYLDSGRDLDVLINNAGIMALPERATSTQGFELQMATNHLGHALLTFLLLDKIKETAKKHGGGRIINVSSGAHRNGAIEFDDLQNEKNYQAWKTYGDSKLANVMFANGLAWKELQGTNVTTASLHPGVISTELGRHAFKGSELLFILLKPLTWLFFKNPKEGAQTTLHCAISDEGAKITAAYWADCARAPLKDKLGQSSSPEAIEKLWEAAKKLVGV